MKAKQIWANLGVKDLERTTAFYTRLGFTPNGASEEPTSFRVGDKDFVLHFFLKDILRSNVQVEIADLTYGNEVVFTLSAESKAEVDHWEKVVEQAGGTIITSAAEFGPGYYGFVFSDPDGHTFNVFYM
jgi:predicted lactoylglutathione lyase